MKQTTVHPANTVTTFSKILAAVLFISLPFLAFIMGMNYQQNQVPAPHDVVIVKTITNRTPVVMEDQMMAPVTDGILPGTGMEY